MRVQSNSFPRYCLFIYQSHWWINIILYLDYMRPWHFQVEKWSMKLVKTVYLLYSLTLSLISPCNDETQAWVCSLQPSHGQGQVASDSDVRSSDICTETRRASNATNTITIPRHSETIRIYLLLPSSCSHARRGKPHSECFHTFESCVTVLNVQQHG